MKKIKFIVLALITVVVISSCQQIFTYSPLTWAQRDPSTLPPVQQIAYAESILTSGDTAAIANAYAVIDKLVTADPANVDLQLLAADLAIGGSGISDAIGNLDLNNLDTSIEAVLSTIDLTLVAASASHVVAAEALDASAISAEQYLNTGLILLAQAADESGDFTTLNSITIGAPVELGEATLIQAEDFIVKGGGSIADYGITVVFP